MANLSTARTQLGAGGGIRRGNYALKDSPGSKPYTIPFTRLGVGGAVRRLGSFAGKTLTSVQPVSATDSLFLTLTEDPVDTQGISTSDFLRFSITEAAVVFRFVDVLDTLSLSISETINLLKAGATDIPVSDTLSLSMTDASALSVSLALLDTLSLSITDVSSIVISKIDVPVVDTLSLAISDISITQIFTGTNAVTAFDDLRFALNEVAIQSEVTEAPPAVPVTRILFSLQVQSVRFELV